MGVAIDPGRVHAEALVGGSVKLPELVQLQHATGARLEHDDSVRKIFVQHACCELLQHAEVLGRPTQKVHATPPAPRAAQETEATAGRVRSAKAREAALRQQGVPSGQAGREAAAGAASAGKLPRQKKKHKGSSSGETAPAASAGGCALQRKIVRISHRDNLTAYPQKCAVPAGMMS